MHGDAAEAGHKEMRTACEVPPIYNSPVARIIASGLAGILTECKLESTFHGGNGQRFMRCAFLLNRATEVGKLSLQAYTTAGISHAEGDVIESSRPFLGQRLFQ